MPLDLSQILSRSEAATPELHEVLRHIADQGRPTHTLGARQIVSLYRVADACRDIPLLCAEVQRLEKERDDARAELSELREKVAGTAADFEWLESKLGLHDGVELLYVVDGYQVDCTLSDGAETILTAQAPTLAEAIRNARLTSDPRPK
jgi:hypothetical protein